MWFERFPRAPITTSDCVVASDRGYVTDNHGRVSQALGYDEKEAQYRLKWCDGSVVEYVRNVWEDNEEVIRHLQESGDGQ
jgi:hypothetical protein